MTQISLSAFEGMIGQEIGQSRWLPIPQSRIDGFAQITEDHQYLHSDPARAVEGPFGGTIAHGYLTLSLMTTMIFEVVPTVSEHPTMINYGIDKLRFLAPVPSGSRVRGKVTLDSLTPREKGGVLAAFRVTVEVKGTETPALVATVLALLT